ncbi:alpha/beta hydrolase [Candidatus Woesearchaeota archaeon]|nr:MAG: alpha/beta hydrolase [Candidatus Woesearchaeota archaeon]
MNLDFFFCMEGERIVIKAPPGVEIVGTFRENTYSKEGILMFPGFTEHRSSLDDLAELLSNHFNVWNFDLNSQGESTGNWDLLQMAESVYNIHSHLKKRHGLRKLGGFGNSIGGMAVGIVASYDDTEFDAICLAGLPVALQDYVRKWQLNLLRKVPQRFLRAATIAYDIFATAVYENYRNLTHHQFKTPSGYRPYAQFGALKIPNLSELIGWIENAPDMMKFVERIHQPVLFIYGGEDHYLKIRHSILPMGLRNMITKTASRKKDVLIVEGADHSLNRETTIDDKFNSDPEYQFVKPHIFCHFMNYLR